MAPSADTDLVITLPYRFDTSSVWRTILKGAVALNAALLVGVLYSLVARPWASALGLVLTEVVVLGFTRVLLRHQTGSVGTLAADRVVIEPNVLFGVALPGPEGTYALDRFSAVRVTFSSGPVEPGVQGRPSELVWLVGRRGTGTPDIVLARTNDGAGRALGQEFGARLRLPVEEVGAPKKIRLP